MYSNECFLVIVNIIYYRNSFIIVGLILLL